jgi:hypothetical protein
MSAFKADMCDDLIPTVRSLPIDAIRDTLSDLPSKFSNIKQALIVVVTSPFDM